MAGGRILWDPVIPNYGRGLRSMSDASEYVGGVIERNRRMEIDEARQRAGQRFMEAQAAAQENRLRAEDARQRTKHGMEIAKYNRELFDEGYKRFLEGGESEAEAYLAASEFVDPQTGQMRTIRLQREEKPRFEGVRLREPGQQQPDPAAGARLGGLLGGGLRPPGEAPEAGKAAASMFGLNLRRPESVPEPQTPESAAVGEKLSGDLEGYRQDMREGRSGRAYMQMPGSDLRVVLDPEERERHKQKKEDERIARLEQAMMDPTLNLDPETRKRLAFQIAQSRGRATAGEAGRISNMETQQDAQAHAASEGDKNRQNKIDVAKLRKKGKGDGKPSLDDRRKEGVIHEQHDRAVKGMVLEQFQFKDISDEAAVTDAIKTLTKGAPLNSATAKLLRGRFTRFGQGSGVLTDRDIKVFYDSIGNIAARTKRTVEELLTGTTDEQTTAEIGEAVAALEATAEARRNMIGGKVEELMKGRRRLFGSEEEWRDTTGAYIKVYAPTYLSTFERNWGKTGTAGTRETGGVSSPDAGRPPGAPGGTTASDKDRKMLEWARANINNPKWKAQAQAVLRANGGK